MKENLAILVLLFVTSFSAAAQQPTSKDPLLDHLAGSWIVQGTIAGHQTTHDIEAEWVLGHEYLRLYETSREKNAQGQPAYEAIIFIEWDEALKKYTCLWLDSTGGGGGLAAPMGTGERLNDSIAAVNGQCVAFVNPDGRARRTTAPRGSNALPHLASTCRVLR